MTKEQALEQLKFHSGLHPDIESTRWTNGFLPSLRPFRGLNREAFANLIECLNVLKDDIKSSKTLEKELMLDLWTICHYAKAWGTDPEGMIRRNNLISAAELKEFEGWINEISYKISFWLEGLDEDE
ncbi:hypothetical protein [Chryseolinea sp. H1M3-3]|uniref:hypothetical protein n=1 Tax=Chryseolinea sp. H1M3-3 TaxID=3034144 RepID=UPI0023ECD45F|nr:hypothetical protein [Chryseolinea sp. H1M3-3]